VHERERERELGIAIEWTVVAGSQECKRVAAKKSCEGAASQWGQEPLNTEAEKSALLGAITRQTLVKMK
jgi:hypothetical protein